MNAIKQLQVFFNTGTQRTRTVKRNILGSIFVKGISILISLILVPMTLGYLTPELYGIWLTLSSIVVWLNFLDVGFTLGLKNKLAEAIAHGDWPRARALVSTTYILMLVIFIPLCLILEIVVPYVNWSIILNVETIYNPQLIQVVAILVVCFCLQMIFNVITSVLAAFQRVALSSIFPVVGNLLACVIIYVLTRTTEGSLVNLAIAISFLPVIVLAVSSCVLYAGSLRKVAPSLYCVDLSLVKQVFGLGLKFFIIQMQIIVLYQSTNLLIAQVGSQIDVTIYNIAYKYLGVTGMLFSIVMGPLWPAFTDAYAKGEYAWMKQAYKKMVLLFVLIACCSIIMMIIANPVYKLWVGSEVVVPLSMTIFVGVYTLIHMWDTLQVILINGIGKIKLQTYITLIGLCLHIPLALILGKYMGALGVVGSMIIINIIYSSFFTVQIHKLMRNQANGIWNL